MRLLSIIALLTLSAKQTWAFPDQGVWDIVLNGGKPEVSVVKSLFKDSTVVLRVSCEDDNVTAPTKLELTWALSRSECWQDYLRNGEEWRGDNGTTTTTDIKCSEHVTLKGPDGRADEIAKVALDGFYVLQVRAALITGAKWEANVTIKLRGPHGYLGAAAWPLLPFYAASCAVHLALGAGWLAACAARWRDLLRLQLWLGAVLLLAMLEAAAFYAALAHANSTGEPDATPLGEILSCAKRALARALVLVAALGFGLVRPRLGPAKGRVAALAALYLAAAGAEAWARAAKPPKPLLLAALPLALLDAAFCWWVFSALVATTRTLRLRRNLVKLQLYRRFTNVLFLAVVASAAFMAYSVHARHLTVCFREWRVLWLDEAFWKMLFTAVLLAMMILWRPTRNNRRYAFSPLTDVADSEDEDEQPVSEAYGVKQRAESVLEEARQRSNEYAPEINQIANSKPEEIKKIIEKAPEAQENKPVVDEENKENINIEAIQAENVNDKGLTEEELLLANAVEESKDGDAIQRAAIVLKMKEGMSSLGRILKTIENYKGTIVHLETRPSKSSGTQFDILVKVDMSRTNLLVLIKTLRQSAALEGVTLLQENTSSVSVKDPWFPRHARDLDKCNHLMTKYEPELDMNHPGFADKVYRERRKQIANIAFDYKYGDPIPYIQYSESEVETWKAVFNTVKELMPKHFCKEYQEVFSKLEDEGIFNPGKIPQLQEMNDFLYKNTGFTLRPAAGLLSARDFLASLAFRVFQSTQYVRHTTSPFHTPEPDCIHELLGHMPLLADTSFAQFSQEIGLASLGASDEEIEKLSTVYWFTVEFGLCLENGVKKAYGAGLLSSYGELLHAISDKPEHRPFEPSATAIQSYQDQQYQPIYYVAESFEDAKEKFRQWVSTMSRPFEVRFNPHTQSVEILDSVETLSNLVSQMNLEMTHLTTALNKLKQNNIA